MMVLYPAAVQSQHDVIITEIMADPSPPVGLPSYEWVELMNVSGNPVNVRGWRFGNANSQSGPLPDSTLQPNERIILCATGSALQLSSFGRCLSITGFPTLDNDGTELFLKNHHGMTVHGIRYSSAWYRNTVKEQGGWSLEMIDTRFPCAGEQNWKASIAGAGATPGAVNSINDLMTDIRLPVLMRSFLQNDSVVVLSFDQSLDSSVAAVPSNYRIDAPVIVTAVTVHPPVFNTVSLHLGTAIQPGKIYIISTVGLRGCGPVHMNEQSVWIGSPSKPAPGDCIINEILFNPRANASDYVELYNNSGKIIDAARLFIANRLASGNPGSMQAASQEPDYIFPHEFRVLTTDRNSLLHQYFVKDPAVINTLPSLPSFPDTEGTVLLMDHQGEVLDEVNYKDDWHFPLVTDPEGVALERIDPDASSQDRNNWTSAASTSGNGTPGYINSHHKRSTVTSGEVTIDPLVFSPGNDGIADFVTIRFNRPSGRSVAGIRIFDSGGRQVRIIENNTLAGSTGSWNWNGLDDRGRKLPVGVYIVLIRFFDLSGKVEYIKKAVVLAPHL